MKVIDKQPTISPVLKDKENGIIYAPVRRGKWKIIDDTEFRVPGWYCSLCNYQISDRYGKYNYCPNCGAKMRGGENG